MLRQGLGLELGLELTLVGREKIRSYRVSRPSPVGDFLVTSLELSREVVVKAVDGTGASSHPRIFLTPSQREPSL